MIIKAYENQKIKKIKNNIFLFYGENDGYKNHVIKDIFIDNYKGNIERFEESEILNNFENFISSLINKSFFDELKLILISRVSEKIIKLINELLDRKIKPYPDIIEMNRIKIGAKYSTSNKKNICIERIGIKTPSISVLCFFKKRKKKPTMDKNASRPISVWLLPTCIKRPSIENDMKDSSKSITDSPIPLLVIHFS